MQHRCHRDPDEVWDLGQADRSVIQSGNLLIVDQSLEATGGDIVIVVVDGQLTVNRFRRTGTKLWFVTETPNQPQIVIG